MIVDFYSNLSDNRVVSKNLSLMKEGVNFILKMPTNSDSPQLDLKKDDDILNSNYCYIRDFGKYYFIESIDFVEGGRIIINCHIDVLQTFGDEIRSLYTFVERQEFKYNPYIVDPELPVKSSRVIGVQLLGELGNPSGNNVALTVSGGALPT